MTLLGTFFALGLLMLKLKRSCEKPPSFEEAVKLALARETLSRDMQGLAECLQMACIHSISDARVIPFLRHTGHSRHTHVGASIPASRGVGKTEAGTVSPNSPRQPQALDNVTGVAERTTIQGTADSRVMSAECAEKKDTYKPCAEAEALQDT